MRSYPQKEDTLRPQKHEHRSRSTSRGPTKLYNADAPRRYAPNESRPRKPPLSPTVEDVGFGPDEVKMRGKPDQTPMLIQVAGDSSSTESNGPLTPESSLSDAQDDHMQTSKDDKKAQGQSNARTARQTTLPSQPLHPRSESRGRQLGLKVDIESTRGVSSGGALSPCTERARSPYSYKAIPQRAKKPDPGESPFSPEPLTPKFSGAPKASNLQPQFHRTTTHDKYSGYNNSTDQSRYSLKRPSRPGIERRASTMPQLGSPASASSARAKHVENSSDESDREHAKIGSRSGQFTADPLPTESISYFDTPPRSERHVPSKNQSSPPRTPLSPEHTRGTFLNKDSLLNGPNLQRLSTLLEDNHSKARKASPRSSPQPSPRGSPTVSPYPSPPRTPPESHHRRTHPIESLKRDSPVSNPSSPLSSRPSSPRPAAQTFNARPMDPNAAGQLPLLTERKPSTSNLVSSDNNDPLLGPKIDVRSPSPAVPRQERKSSHELSDAERQPRQASYTPSNAASSLNTASHSQYQRSSSPADLRRALPPLSTKSATTNQATDIPASSGSRHRSGSYVPASAGAVLGANLFDPASSSGRSRSTAPDASSHHRHRSRSRTTSDVRPVPRARSTAPIAFMPVSDSKQPIMLPQCPRPEPVAGYSDWYSLDQHPEMAICPDCRHNIFGNGYERAFRRRSAPQRDQKLYCSMNEPWTRFACLSAFKKNKRTSALLRDLGDLTEISNEEPICPQHKLSEESIWYHLRDSETNRDFEDFQVCSHCVFSLEIIWPNIGDIFYKTNDLKKEPRTCSLRSDIGRLGKFMDLLDSMSQEARRTGVKPPPTSDFIWEVKWLTVIDACKGDGVHYGQDMHKHPDLPELTICEECYYKNVRPVLKATRRDSRHFVHGITPEAKEIVGGASCKLYSPRMKQIFDIACRERDFEYLQKAVRKRNDLQIDLEEAKMLYHKTPRDVKAKKEMDYLMEKWRKLERKHE